MTLEYFVNRERINKDVKLLVVGVAKVMGIKSIKTRRKLHMALLRGRYGFLSCKNFAPPASKSLKTSLLNCLSVWTLVCPCHLRNIKGECMVQPGKIQTLLNDSYGIQRRKDHSRRRCDCARGWRKRRTGAFLPGNIRVRLSARYCLPHVNYENISTFLHFVLNFLPTPRASWHTITTEDWLFHFLSKLAFFSWR